MTREIKIIYSSLWSFFNCFIFWCISRPDLAGHPASCSRVAISSHTSFLAVVLEFIFAMMWGSAHYGNKMTRFLLQPIVSPLLDSCRVVAI